MSELAFRTAREQVQLFTDQSRELLAEHCMAMECRDCEDFLQLGIDAFRWIQRAYDHMRQCVYDKKVAFSQEAENAVTDLYASWLLPCNHAQKWAQIQLDRGYYPDNLDEFRQCREEVEDILEQRSLLSMGRRARLTSDEDGHSI